MARQDARLSVCFWRSSFRPSSVRRWRSPITDTATPWRRRCGPRLRSWKGTSSWLSCSPSRFRTASTRRTRSCSKRCSGRTSRRSRPPPSISPTGSSRWRCSTRRSRSAASTRFPNRGDDVASSNAGRATCAGWPGSRWSRGPKSSHGSFRHLHQLFEGKSVLIAYAAKKSETGHTYYVAAKLDLGLIIKSWIPDEMDVIAGKRQVAILDEVGRAGLSANRQPPTPFQYEASFGKTLYAWRIQITPRTWRSCAPRPRRSACSACC